jgi:hypothetical protein
MVTPLDAYPRESLHHAMSALKGAEVYDRYLDDAHASEHEDVTDFIRRCKREDEQHALDAHELLGTLTRNHGIG